MDIADFQAFETSLLHDNEFDQFNDFLNTTNFEELIGCQIREDTGESAGNFASNFYGNCHQPQQVGNELMFFNDCATYDNNQFCSTPGELVGFSYSATDDTSATLISDPAPAAANPDSAPSFNALDIDGLLDEEEDGVDYWSGTTTARTSSSKRDTSCLDSKKILSSERTRRVRMKHKLYALRALVPNITKMDKASIVGDAVSYVQDLQKQAKKLKTEIAELESSSTNKGESSLNLVKSPKNNQVSAAHKTKHQVCKKILKMDVFQVEEGAFCVRLACNKGEGVAVSFYKALDSLTSLDVQSSNFTTSHERLVFAFTVNIKECGENKMDLSNLKSWLNRALLNQGFEYKLNNI